MWSDPVAVDLLTVMGHYRELIFSDLEVRLLWQSSTQMYSLLSRIDTSSTRSAARCTSHPSLQHQFYWMPHQQHQGCLHMRMTQRWDKTPPWNRRSRIVRGCRMINATIRRSPHHRPLNRRSVLLHRPCSLTATQRRLPY
jgi:hypothetical protein